MGASVPQEAGAGGHIATGAVGKVPSGGILPISVTTVVKLHARSSIERKAKEVHC